LKKFGVISSIDKDDMINASIEDNARSYSDVVEKLQASLFRRIRSNGHLRESIRLAKQRTNSFADFERLAIGRREDQ
jgi:hypothetical protein